MLFRLILVVVLNFFIAGMSHAVTGIKTFSYQITFVKNVQKFATDKIKELQRHNRIIYGDIFSI